MQERPPNHLVIEKATGDKKAQEKRWIPESRGSNQGERRKRRKFAKAYREVGVHPH